MPGLRGPSALLRLQSDERLIALTRSGNHAAFEVLCTRYQSRLLAFCRHMLNSKEDAEDVLQEVYAAAFNAVRADEREINVRPWLYRIARNRSLNHLRRTTSIGVDTMDVHFAEGGLSTTDKVMRRENFRELIADVQELPETQRTALLLREIDALSYEQIAQAMETTVPSVKSLLVRARISLAEASESRKLSCEEVRLELGEAAEGLTKVSTPARRHVRSCERCRSFRKHLKDNNKALAAILPVAPLFLAKKLLLTKLGSTASAGGAHVAGGAGAGAGAGIGAGAGASAGAGAAAGGTSLAGGVMTAGAGAIATKAVAGLAAAAIVTAGAVAVGPGTASRRTHSNYAAAPAVTHVADTIVVHQQAQPSSPGGPTHRALTALRAARAHRAAAVTAAATRVATPTPVATTAPPSPVPGAAVAPASQEATEVTTESTQLPASATAVPTPATPPAPPITTPAPSETPATPPAGEAPAVAAPPVTETGGTDAPVGASVAVGATGATGSTGSTGLPIPSSREGDL